MNLEFEANEFTMHELLNYIKAAYRLQINGAPFTANNINNWIRINKVPDAYGGHKILNVIRAKEFNNYKVLTLDGLTRDILNDLHLLNNNPVKKLPKTKRPRKQRTELYYKILEEAGKQSTRKTKLLATLPENWKEAGIKSNQLKQRKPPN